MNQPLPNSYTIMAKYYDYLMSDYDYLAIRNYIVNNIPKGKGLDIACGTGRLAIELAKLGYNMTGIDKSMEMLDKGIQSAIAEGVKIPFIYGDMSNLELNGKYDLILLMCDTINYIDKDILDKLIKNIYLHLKVDGSIILEFSSKEKLINMIGNNTILQDYDNLTIIWDNTLLEEYVKMNLIFFEKVNDDKYLRREETHIQYIYDLDYVVNNLEDNGYRVLEIIDSKTNNAPTINTDRILIKAGI